ncbi:MAG: valine--tRNA ligase [Muribaculaceae bacterium]|nr:valine--tRNA ligase [Muribaculaceae bacterium]
MNTLATKYDPKEVEDKWYKYWMDHHLFRSVPDEREPYTIVIPPPNVTGVLHMGHMLNETIQDILIRHARMEGKNALWVPGTDHASIATEAKVVNRLAQQGIKKTDLSRDEFLKHAWDWTHEHGGIILKQLRKLGASCDWDRTAFTMDEVRSRSVIKVFCDLYNKGLIYRGVRMVNWDPKALTALSDEEVVYKDEHSKLYYLKYRVVEQNDVAKKDEGNILHRDDKGYYAVVATTRPETIMGDTAMCINPNDVKNTWLKGKHVIVPLVGREIPVIEDDYVDIDFGTGCLKVTPAHDPNDHMLGDKYNLESIDIFNDNGTLSEAAGLYVGMDRFDVRRQIEKDLASAGLLEKVEAYDNKVGFSERTNVPIEPKLSMQWFLKMSDLTKPALAAVENGDINFVPKKYINTYRHWMTDTKDWCISRQLWWGHRIPAYFLPKGGYVVAETKEEALKLAQAKDPDVTLDGLRQDEDCLDTWFSSWLWPISLFDGICHPDNPEIKYYYPTSDLVTGPDIIFFWVARMIMAGYEYMGDKPFKNVYFTGIVRDKLGRKMSKSLGNSPDPLELIDRYGADGVRMGMMLAAPAGNDILYDDSLCEQGRNFNNKIWNAFRLVKGWQVADIEQPEHSKIAVQWFQNVLDSTLAEVEDLFSKFRLNEALMAVYRLFWEEFSAWYLEIVKPAYQQPVDRATLEATLRFFDILLRLLHPFMPFITEELYQALPGSAETIMTQAWPTFDAAHNWAAEEEAFEKVMDYIKAVRTMRTEMNVHPAKKTSMIIETADAAPFQNAQVYLAKFAFATDVTFTEKYEGSTDGMVQVSTHAARGFIPMMELIDREKELARLNKEKAKAEKEMAMFGNQLNNPKFVERAPAALVEDIRNKFAKSQDKLANIEQSIKALG